MTKLTNLICTAGLLILLLSRDSSVMTSLIWDRGSVFWSAWMFKKGLFSVADLIIIALSFVVYLRLIKKPVILYSPYLMLCLLISFYLTIGFIYNIAVYPFWKTFFYDLKIVLLLIVPYILLSQIKSRRIRNLFKPEFIVLYFILSQLIDYTIVILTGGAPESINIFHLPMLPFAFGFIFTIPAFVYATKVRYRVLFGTMFLMDVMQYLNVGGLYGFFKAFEYGCLIFFLRFRMSLKGKVAALLILIISFHIISFIALTNPITASIKPIDTRMIQLKNVWENFNRNIPGVIGKGLGSTWFEVEKIPEYDIYSVGTSLGQDIERAMEKPVKFVFNYWTASLLYKWGIIGSLLLIAFAGNYLYRLQANIDKLNAMGIAKDRIKYLKAVSFISFFFVYNNFQMIGSCYYSLLTSLFAFYIQDQFSLSRSIMASEANA